MMKVSGPMIITVLVTVLVCEVKSYRSTGHNDTKIKRVHIVHMNHLDVGYDGIYPQPGLVNNIINKYFHVYFPRAIEIAKNLTEFGYVENFIYTTHPWLVSLYIECPTNLVLSGIKLKCPDDDSRDRFIAAVKSGVITYHAGPMNMQFEMFDKSLAEYGLKMSAELDSFFNITRKHKTLSQRDVPGMTASMIPLFVKENIVAISVGVNAVTAPPDVPTIFNWKFMNYSVLAMWHPGGYPDNPGKHPDKPGGMSKHDCVTYPGLEDALCWAFRTDNSGPPVSVSEVLNDFEIARGQFPGATVRSSTFENFVGEAIKIKDFLPVIEKEIGDTWIEGVASDPQKTAQMRAFMRERAKCIEMGQCSQSHLHMRRANRWLVKLVEHTWGIDRLHDKVNYSNENFYKQLKERPKNYTNALMSWEEQRNFTNLALEALGNHPLSSKVKKAFRDLKAKMPDLSGYKRIQPDITTQCGHGYQIRFNLKGFVDLLFDPVTKVNWASPEHPIGQFVYQTQNQTDFDKFTKLYAYGPKWFIGFGKPNMTENVKVESRNWYSSLVSLFQKSDGSCNFHVNVTLEDYLHLRRNYSAPQQIWINYAMNSENSLFIELQWFNKTPTRLPESLYFVFKPTPIEGNRWHIQKLGQLIDPLNVVKNGSQRLHAIDGFVQYKNIFGKGISLHSLDCAIVNVLTPESDVSPLPIPLEPISSIIGMAFNLFNNVWNVNYVFWNPFMNGDESVKYRFHINFSDERLFL